MKETKSVAEKHKEKIVCLLNWTETDSSNNKNIYVKQKQSMKKRTFRVINEKKFWLLKDKLYKKRRKEEKPFNFKKVKQTKENQSKLEKDSDAER